jgi:LCP family protein required for cell wall assembly
VGQHGAVGQHGVVGQYGAPPDAPGGGGLRTRRAAQAPPSGNLSGDLSDELYDQDRRGSHATTQGQGFSWVLLWTILGAAIPGAGLIAAGWRRLGALLLILLGLAALGLLALIKFGNIFKQGISVAVDPQKLLIVAVIAGVGAAGWVLVVVLTTAQLRRYANLTAAQGAFCTLVASALVVGIAVPAYKVSSYALITRSVVSSSSVFTGNSDNTSTRPDVKQADPWAGKPRVNVLLIGSDAGSDRTGVRPDTMILASINTKTGNTVLFSLPRNLQHAPFAPGSPGEQAWPNGYYCPNVAPGMECLLNAIWTWASTGNGKELYKKYKNPGLRATEDAVSGVTGLKVDNYVMLNLNGFKDFVDAMGGVTVDVHERLPIGGNSEHPVATGGYIEPGNNQHLDGFHALWFARSRWSTSDYDRMARQRCVIGDVVAEANPAKLALNFPAIAKTLKKNLSTGIATSDLQAWVTLSQRVKDAKVTSLPFSRPLVDTTNPDFDQIHELVTKALKTSDTVKPKPTATPGATPAATATKKATTKKAKKNLDPAKAQDVKAVC